MHPGEQGVLRYDVRVDDRPTQPLGLDAHASRGVPNVPEEEFDDDLPLEAGAQPDEIASAEDDMDGDDATPICLRCFTPLPDAPTNCPHCGAPASRAASLGPALGGGVDAYGPTVKTLTKGRDGRPSVWGHAVVWGLGMVLIPMGVETLSWAFGWDDRADRPFLALDLLELGVLAIWTLVFAGLVIARVRENRRDADREARSPDEF